jgi:hypothetical protein
MPEATGAGGWRHKADAFEHRQHPGIRIGGLELGVGIEGRQALDEAIERPLEDAAIGFCPTVGLAPHAFAEVLAEQRGPLFAAYAVVVHHTAIVEEQDGKHGHRAIVRELSHPVNPVRCLACRCSMSLGSPISRASC